MVRRPSLCRALVFALALAQIPMAIRFVGVQPAQAASWFSSSWGFRKAITIDHTKVGATLTNFPVSINLASDASLSAHALSNGNDILFTSSDGVTKLNHEIETYTSASGALAAWVQVPSLSSTVDTVIYMYYGNAAAANQQNTTGTWDGTFQTVWHMNNGSSPATDSTSNALSGAQTGGVTFGATGKFGNATSYATGTGQNQYLSVLLPKLTSFTVSMWIFQGGSDSYGTLVTQDVNNGIWYRGAAAGASANKFSFFYGSVDHFNNTAMSTSAWHHLVVVNNAGAVTFYLDGNSDGTATAGPAQTFKLIGSDSSGSFRYGGTIDETRVANVARTATWISTEFNNQNSPSTFYSLGTETTTTATWTGAVNGLWSNAGNWSGIGGVAPSTGNDLVFPGGASNLSTSNDLTAGTSFNSITISGNGYTLAGNSVALGAGNLSDTNASGSNTISLPLSAAATRTVGVSNSAETLTIGGAMSGSAPTKTGSGTLVLSGANSYSGTTTISAGTLKLGAANSIPSGSALSVSGTFDLAGFGDTVGSITGAGTVTDSSTTAATLTAGGDNTSTAFSGVIQDGSGTLALTKAGSGTLTLSGASTYSGATTISAGTLSIAADGNLGTAPGSATASQLIFGGGTLATTATFTLNSNRGIAYNSTGSIDVASSTTLSYGGIATGSGGLTKTDTGTLALSGASTFTGVTTINAGTLSIAADNNLGTAPGSATAGKLTFGGGTLATTASFTLSANRGIAFTSTGTIDNASGTTLTYGGIAAGAGGLTKTDTGTLTLSGANTYTGATTINAGTLQVGADNNLGSAPGAATAGQLTFTGGTLATTASFTLGTNRGIAFTSNGTIDVAPATTLTYGGIAAGAGGLTTTDSGTLAWTGTNTYTGATTLSAGTLQANGDRSFGAVPGSATPGSVTFAGGTLAATATFTLSPKRGIAFNSTGTIDVASGLTLTYGGIAAGSAGLVKTSAGILILSGANTYGGATTISAGTLALGVANSVPSSSAVTATGTFDLAGLAGTIGSLAGSGTVTNSGGANAILTTGGDNTSTLFSGVIQDGTKKVALTKGGTGTMTLSGANSYTSATTINGGTLQIGADINLGTAPASATAGQLTFGGGALATTASFTLSSNRGIAFTSTGTIDNSSGTTLTYGGIAAGAGGLTKTDSGTLAWTGANTFTGATTINGGTLQVDGDASFGGVPASATAGSITFSGGTLSATATFTLNSKRGIAFTSTGTIDTASATVLTYGGIAAGSGGLIKTSAGTLTLSGANTYGGATTISAGTLKLGVANSVPSGSAVTATGTFDLAGFADTIGSLSGGGTVTDSSATAATLTAGGDNTSTNFSGAIQNGSGSIALTKSGTGTLTLGGTNTYSGTTTVSAGTLLVNGAQGSSNVSLNGGTLGGSGTIGTLASTASGGTINPGTTTAIITSGNINLSTGSPTFKVDLNGTTAGTNYDQLTTSGTINLSGATLAGTVGFTPANGSSFTIINNTGGGAITGTFSGLAEGATVTLGGWAFKVSYLGGAGHSVILTTGTPVLSLVNSVSPSAMLQPPGTDLAYTIAFTNSGGLSSANLVISDPIPNNTDFKVGSASSSLGTTGLSVSVAYSNNGGSTYAYTPVSGGGGAATGYDRTVTNIRWTFTGSLSQTAPNNAGSVTYTAKIQ